MELEREYAGRDSTAAHFVAQAAGAVMKPGRGTFSRRKPDPTRPMTRRHGLMNKPWFAISAVLALAACETISEPVPVVCPGVVPPSVNVTVLDSISGANVTPGATLVLRNATIADSVVVPTAPPGLTSMGVGEDRTGTFTLTVRQAGYRPWTRANVAVERGRCGALTVSVTARLTPAP